MKPNWNELKLSTCLHETGMKITKFSIYSPCQAIFFFRMAFVSMCCSLVPMSTFIPVSSEIPDLCEIPDQAGRVRNFARAGAKYMTLAKG